MKLRRLFIWCVLALVVGIAAHAQTMDYDVRFGMRPSKSTPPEVIDMKWARQYMDTNATLESNATEKE